MASPAKPKKAFTALSELVGTQPPAALNTLSADELETLNRILGESIELHEAAIAEAEENVVQIAPRPLRGTVRKILGSGA